jgi:hypothetical protein
LSVGMGVEREVRCWFYRFRRFWHVDLIRHKLGGVEQAS